MSKPLSYSLRLSIPLTALVFCICSNVWADDSSWRIASSGHDAPEATDSLREPLGGTDAIYGLNREQGYVRLPYDGTAPAQVKFGDMTQGMTLDEDSEPCVLTEEPLSANAFVSCRIGLKKLLSNSDDQEDVWWLSPHISLIRKESDDIKYSDNDYYERLLSLVSDGNHLFVITTDRVLSIWKGQKEWKQVALNTKLEYFGSRSVHLVLGGDTLWYGEDKGEFGGAFMRLNLTSGEVHTFDGIANVTGMLKDKANPGCVIFSTGLSHLFISSGQLQRACGDKVEDIYSSNMPIWGLFENDGQDYALMQTGVVPIKDGKFDYSVEQKFQDLGIWKLNDIPVTRFGNALFLYLNARGNDSTGGAGSPFVVMLPSGVKPVLTPVSSNHH